MLDIKMYEKLNDEQLFTKITELNQRLMKAYQLKMDKRVIEQLENFIAELNYIRGSRSYNTNGSRNNIEKTDPSIVTETEQTMIGVPLIEVPSHKHKDLRYKNN